MVRMYDHTPVGRSLMSVAGRAFHRAAGFAPSGRPTVSALFSVPCAPGFRERIFHPLIACLDVKESPEC